MVLADQHCFDPSRAELNAEDGLSAIDCFGDIVSIHVHLSEELKASLQIGIAGVSGWFVKLPATKKRPRCGFERGTFADLRKSQFFRAITE
jgi:hypothetical protein